MQKSGWENDEVAMYVEDVALDQVALYLAHRPGLKVSAAFVKISVNGKRVDPFSPGQLSGAQGFYVNLGWYEKSSEILIEWELMTGAISGSIDITFGVYRNRQQDRTILKQLKIAEFSEYTDSATVAA